MHFVNIHETKTHLSDYLKRIEEKHEEFVICRNGKPIAEMREYNPPKGGLKLGGCEGKIWISDDFDETPEEFMPYCV